MAVVGSDNFNDTSGTALASHTPSGGGAWVEHGSVSAGSMVISDANRARQGTAFSATAYYHNATPASNEYDVEADMVQISDNDGSYDIYARLITSAFTGYGMRLRQQSGGAVVAFQLIRINAGTVTILASQNASAANINARLQMRTAAKKMFENDVEVASPGSTDDTLTSVGFGGIGGPGNTVGNTTGYHWDNYLCEDTSGAGGGVTATPDVGALTLEGFAPTIQTPRTVQTGLGELTLTGFAPVVTASNHITVQPQPGDLVLGAFAPTILTPRTVTPGVGDLVLTGFAPTVTVRVNTNVEPGAGALSLTGFAPSVSATAHVAVTAGTGALVFTGFAPDVEGTVVEPEPVPAPIAVSRFSIRKRFSIGI